MKTTEDLIVNEWNYVETIPAALSEDSWQQVVPAGETSSVPKTMDDEMQENEESMWPAFGRMRENEAMI